MFGNIVAPKATISAREILKQYLPAEEPTMDRAIALADELMEKHGMYVNANYLLDVWMRK